jgi:broad specificity phosphatase PhoE
MELRARIFKEQNNKTWGHYLGGRMVIGLVRHFKVNCDTRFFMSANEFEEWVRRYDNSDVLEKKHNPVNITWDECYSSDLRRAIITSRTLFSGEITESPLLREVPLSPVFKTKLKLPYIFWCIMGRSAWFFQHKSQKEVRKDTQRRVRKFLDDIDDKSCPNILIVCHGFLMNTMQKELKRRGYNGQHIKRPKNGEIYLYELSVTSARNST